MASFFSQLLQGTSSLLIFFLILAANYEGYVFSCHFRKKLMESVWLKHLIGFGILYVFVVQFTKVEESIPKSFLISFVLYVWFFLLMRLPLTLTLLNIFALFVLYVLQEYKDIRKNRPEKQKTLKIITKVQVSILCVSFVLTVVGVGYTLHRDWGTGLSLGEFVKGVPDRTCLKESSPE